MPEVLSEAVKNDAQIVVRLPTEVLEAIDRYVDEQRAKTGFQISRAEGVRRLIVERLGIADAPPTPPKARTRKK